MTSKQYRILPLIFLVHFKKQLVTGLQLTSNVGIINNFIYLNSKKKSYSTLLFESYSLEREKRQKSTNEIEDSNMEIEVEQKFALPHYNHTPLTTKRKNYVHPIEQKLHSLGFQSCGATKRFTDTYMDLESLSSSLDHVPSRGLSNNDHWILTVKHNHWLRYRELKDDTKGIKKGSWQLKRPPSLSRTTNEVDQSSPKNNKHIITVYEELEDNHAIMAVQGICKIEDEASIQRKKEQIEILPSKNARQKNDICWNDEIPYPLEIPTNYKLKPFASFETRRTSWIYSDIDGGSEETCDRKNNIDNNDNNFCNYKDLRVDLDTTDFGYMVGEVETMVKEQNQIDLAKSLIQKLISELTGCMLDGNNNSDDEQKKIDASLPAYGKLETYLMKHCPEHYEACKNSGSM